MHYRFMPGSSKKAFCILTIGVATSISWRAIGCDEINYGTPQSISNVDRTRDVELCDLDSDGDQDILASARISGSPDVICIFESLGENGFKPRGCYEGNDEHSPDYQGGTKIITLNDMDHDNHDDLIFLSGSQGNYSLVIAFGDGDFGFGNELVIPLPYHSVSSFDCKDIDGDGWLDLLIGNDPNLNLDVPEQPGFTVYWGGSSGFVEGDWASNGNVSIQGQHGGEGPRCYAVFDIDGDTDLDVVILNNIVNGHGYDISVFRQSHVREFLLVQNIHFGLGLGSLGTGIVSFDVNGDFANDLILTHTNGVAVCENLFGLGIFSPPEFRAGAGTTDLYDPELVDLNCDGVPELLTGVNDNKLNIYDISSNPFSLEKVIQLPPETAAFNIAVGDIRGLGFNDIVSSGWGASEFVVISQNGDEVCTLDYNEDFAYNFLDVTLFLQGFAQSNLQMDINDDGVLNFLDVSLFLSMYSQGCP